MTIDPSEFLSDQSRRTVLKKGALASSALALGLGSTTSVGAQGQGDEENKALMFNDAFRPGAEFRVVSPVLEWTPDVEGVQEGDVFSDYNTRMIRYTNTEAEARFFPTNQAEVQEGEVYRLHRNFSLFEDDAADEGVVSATFEPVADDDLLVADEDDDQFGADDYDLLEGGGKVLLRASNFFGGALLRIESGVVEWTPREAVEDSDIFSEYNTRFAQFLNTNQDFEIYPAQEAEIEEGGIYVLRDEFDITPPEGDLVTAELNRVDEDDADDGIEDLLDELDAFDGETAEGNVTDTANETTG
jgi:hypothetical protein